MKRTTSTVPYNPQGIGIEYPFTDDTIKCRAGKVTFRSKTHDVTAKTVTPQTYAGKLGQTEVWVVFDGTKAVYHIAKSSPGVPAKDFDELGLIPLFRPAIVQIPAGNSLADADGQIVEFRPMIETVYKKRIGKDGKPITKHVTEKFPDGSVTERDVPLMEQTDRIVTV